MHHFFVDPAQVMGDFIRITGPDVNHMKNALRMKQGEEVLVSDGTGTDYHCCLSSLNSDYVEARIVSADRDGMELGAAGIVPVSTKNAVVKLDAKKEEAKRKRWQAIAESAAKQSGRSLMPQVMGLMTLGQAFDYIEKEQFALRLIPYEHEDGMEGSRQELSRVAPGQDIAVFIGPEGGFDEAEISLALKKGVRPVSLGKRILRTETAGLAMLSVLMMRLEGGL